MQFTIESRELTSERSHPPGDPQSESRMIEAANADDAITEFVRQSACELVSLTKPAEGRESIATVKKEDSLFLVRVYSA